MEWTDVLRSLSLQGKMMIYTTASVAVYSGEYQQYPVVFKILRLPTHVDYQEIEKECQQMLAVQDENVVKLYNYRWTQTNTGTYLVMVLELCDKDLAKDIRDRASNRYMYTEQELWNFVFSLIRAFANMQRKGLAHRDIKPENIFLSRGVVKVGDFGASRNSMADQMTATLIGTPIYLSPILRQGLTANQLQATHNAFKSDVYSLGLTLLALARLEPPVFTINAGDSQVQSIISALQYSEVFKRFLSWMLTWEESNRPDFLQIDEWITATFYSQPAASQPATFQPAAPQPATFQPAAPQPATFQPAAPQPATFQPAAPQPATSQPATYQYATPAVQPAVPQTPTGSRPMQQPSAGRANIPVPVSVVEEVKIQVEPRSVPVASASRARAVEPNRREEETKVAQSHKVEPKSHPSDITSPYQQQPPTHCHYDREPLLAYGQSPKLQCLYCHGTIRPNNFIVALKCNPDFHVFCSVECLSREVWRQQGPRRCPVCEASIDQEDLDFYCVSAEPPGFFAQAWRYVTGLVCCNRTEQ